MLTPCPGTNCHVLFCISYNHALIRFFFIDNTGYSVLSKRTKWCNDKFGELYQGELYARLGASQLSVRTAGMIWRCYRDYAIDALKMTYNFGSGGYHSTHHELLAITD